MATLTLSKPPYYACSIMRMGSLFVNKFKSQGQTHLKKTILASFQVATQNY